MTPGTICLAIVLLLICAQFSAAQNVQTLTPNSPIERELTSQETHKYRINLKAGQFVQVIAAQQSIDILMALSMPNRNPLTEADMTSFGLQETISAIATTNGNYELRIQTVSPPNIQGKYQLTLAVKNSASELDNKRIQAERLMRAYRDEPNQQKKIAMAEQARAIWQELGDKFYEAITVANIGLAQNSLNERTTAYSTLEQSLSMLREQNNRSGEGFILGHLALICDRLGNWEKGINLVQQTLAIAKETGNQTSALQQLHRLGLFHWQLNQNEKAESAFAKMLALSRTTKDRANEGQALYQLGRITCYGLTNCQQSLTYFEQALPIAHEIDSKTLQGALLGNLSQVAMMIGKIEKAIEYSEASIQAAKANGNRSLEAGILLENLFNIYKTLGRKEKARATVERALAISRESNNRFQEAFGLLVMGMLYEPPGSNPKELEYYEQALKILRENNLTKGVQINEVLNAIAAYHVGANNPNKAIEYYLLYLTNIRELKMRNAEPWALRGLGAAYRKLKQFDKAIELHELALRMRRANLVTLSAEFKLPSGDDPLFLASLMQDWKESGNTDLAIFYGKLAINRFQDYRAHTRIRSEQRELQQELQKTYEQNNEKYYRELADLLIAQARLPEAEQVLCMLKEEEYFEYIRGDATYAPKGEKATLTPKEEAANKRYHEIADTLAALGAERSALLNKNSRSPEEEKRLVQIESNLAIAGQAFQKFLDQLSNELKTTKDTSKVSQLRDAQGLMEDLRELGNGVVALYTVIGEDKYSVVLTTADIQKAYQSTISAADLNRKVLAFRAALQNPTIDPLPLAQELYKILLAPVENDLRAANAKLLMWSLDGALRYVPMAALHDGKKYLVENYRHAVFTPASNARLHLTPSKNWRALGLGVTKAHGAKIPALPGVAEEMRGIIKTEDNDSGVLPGSIKLDEQFTQEAMMTGLREHNNVVHIASHFQFQPGNETNSALLLGDGQFLSLAQIKVMPQVFSGVELLTLSACNTATGGSSANGKEVEGFGVLAQLKGARAVVASLWPVADRSTTQLMQEFYQLRETGLTKVEAIRQAQNKMLQGEIIFKDTIATRSIVHEENVPAKQGGFKIDPRRPFAHPYYWAPFILIGNWK